MAGNIPPLQKGDVSTEIVFRDRDDIIISYRVLGDVVEREIDGGGYEALSMSAFPVGVEASCPSACFTLIEDDPQVVSINIILRQAGGAGSVVFRGEVQIKDTIVIRETYGSR